MTSGTLEPNTATQAVRAALAACDAIQEDALEGAAWQAAETVRAAILQHVGPDQF